MTKAVAKAKLQAKLRISASVRCGEKDVGSLIPVLDRNHSQIQERVTSQKALRSEKVLECEADPKEW